LTDHQSSESSCGPTRGADKEASRQIKNYDRQIVDHLVTYSRGHVHTYGLENIWSLLKRAVKETDVNVELVSSVPVLR
jgi:5-methylcytosine-specific restriction endonuclease McrA